MRRETRCSRRSPGRASPASRSTTSFRSDALGLEDLFAAVREQLPVKPRGRTAALAHLCDLPAAFALAPEPAKQDLGVAADHGQEVVEVDDMQSATDTLESDLDDLGEPDTEAGQQAKESVDQLGDDLNTGADSIESATDDVSDANAALAAASSVKATLATMSNQVSSTSSCEPATARRQGRAEDRVRAVELLPAARELVLGFLSRRRPDSNWCTRLCRPLPNHSATAPRATG